MDPKKLNESYTEFGAPGSPSWMRPDLVLGRFFSRFFANKAKPIIARGEEVPNQFIVPADAGDTVLDPDTIGSPGVGYSRNGFIVVSQKEIKRKDRYKEYEEMDEYPEIGCLRGNSKIFTLDRGWIRIDQLEKEKLSNFYVIAYDFKSKSLIPAIATASKMTGAKGHKKPMVSVVLDNGNTIECTSDHLFLTKEGKWVEAGILSVGERLMPGNTRMRHLGGKPDSSYWQLYQPHSDSLFKNDIENDKRWVWIHRLVAQILLGHDGSLTVHHKDYTSLNNHPDNLEILTLSDHAKKHIAEIDNTKYFPGWTSERRKAMSLRMTGNTISKGNKLSAETKQKMSSIRKGKLKSEEHKRHIGEAHRIKISKEKTESAYKSTNSVSEMASILNVSWSTAKRLLKRYDLVSDYSNHRVLRVDVINCDDAIYDIEVPKYHNFLCNGIIVHNSAFDIYADEITQKGNKGERWFIDSDSELIKKEVENLFDIIKLENFYWDISRNTVKYGDCFIELVVDLDTPNAGIQKIKVLNPNFILRVENEYGYLEGFLQEIPDKNDWSSFGTQGESLTKNKYIKLDKNQIVHFRVHTSNPYYYPYGKSIAANATRIFRSLMMMEDAMLVYRLNRAPERLAFYINVQGLPPAKAKAYMEELQRNIQKTKFYDKPINQVDERMNPISVTENYYIPIKGSSDGTKIETIQGAGNLGEVDDVKYFRDKLLAVLKIPKDFLVEKDKSPERKANLGQLDVKFARTIIRNQQCVQLGLEEVAKRHLQLKGFPESQINRLKIILPEPSDLYVKRKLDVEEQKARVVKAVQGIGMFSRKYIYSNFYDLTESQAEKIQKELEADIELESQGIIPSINPVGGMMETGAEMGMGEDPMSQDAEQGQFETGGESRENKPPTSESVRNILNKSSNPKLIEVLGKRIITEKKIS